MLANHFQVAARSESLATRPKNVKEKVCCQFGSKYTDCMAAHRSIRFARSHSAVKVLSTGSDRLSAACDSTYKRDRKPTCNSAVNPTQSFS